METYIALTYPVKTAQGADMIILATAILTTIINIAVIPGQGFRIAPRAIGVPVRIAAEVTGLFWGSIGENVILLSHIRPSQTWFIWYCTIDGSQIGCRPFGQFAILTWNMFTRYTRENKIKSPIWRQFDMMHGSIDRDIQIIVELMGHTSVILFETTCVEL